jgi:ketosteroid isomerase-like protein
MSQENTDLLRAVYKAWEAGDLRAGQDLLDAEIESVWPTGFPSAGAYRGRAGHVRAMREWLSPWEDFSLVAEGLFEADDRVVVPFRVRARGRGSGIEVERRRRTSGPCDAAGRFALRCRLTRRRPSKPWGWRSSQCRRT